MVEKLIWCILAVTMLFTSIGAFVLSCIIAPREEDNKAVKVVIRLLGASASTLILCLFIFCVYKIFC